MIAIAAMASKAGAPFCFGPVASAVWVGAIVSDRKGVIVGLIGVSLVGTAYVLITSDVLATIFA